MASFLLATLAGGEPRAFPVRQMSAVGLLAKLLITCLSITLSVINVNRYYDADTEVRPAMLYSLDP